MGNQKSVEFKANTDYTIQFTTEKKEKKEKKGSKISGRFILKKKTPEGQRVHPTEEDKSNWLGHAYKSLTIRFIPAKVFEEAKGTGYSGYVDWWKMHVKLTRHDKEDPVILEDFAKKLDLQVRYNKDLNRIEMDWTDGNYTYWMNAQCKNKNVANMFANLEQLTGPGKLDPEDRWQLIDRYDRPNVIPTEVSPADTVNVGNAIPEEEHKEQPEINGASSTSGIETEPENTVESTNTDGSDGGDETAEPVLPPKIGVDERLADEMKQLMEIGIKAKLREAVPRKKIPQPQSTVTETATGPLAPPEIHPSLAFDLARNARIEWKRLGLEVAPRRPTMIENEAPAENDVGLMDQTAQSAGNDNRRLAETDSMDNVFCMIWIFPLLIIFVFWFKRYIVTSKNNDDNEIVEDNVNGDENSLNNIV